MGETSIYEQEDAFYDGEDILWLHLFTESPNL